MTGLLVEGSLVAGSLILKIISSVQTLNRISFVTPDRAAKPDSSG
jgi:hypothetical protein